MTAIIDYGMGNIHSVQKALESLGAKTLVTNEPKELEDCRAIVLPGVGAFGDAVSQLKKRDLLRALNEHIKRKKIFLGICLGMHILFEASEESPKAKGLGVFKGRVKKFEVKKVIKVPHIGWNQLKVGSGLRAQGQCPLLKDVPDNSYVYFCHSYYPAPKDKQIVAATSDYGVEFPAVIWQDNIYGVQFHPEKSQEVGLRILKNFVELIRHCNNGG